MSLKGNEVIPPQVIAGHILLGTDPAMSLREESELVSGQKGALTRIFGHLCVVPKKVCRSYFYAAAGVSTAAARAAASSLPTRSDSWAPLPVQ
jgi:hypothetical protein